MNTVDQQEFNVVLNHVYGDAVTASRIIAGALWLDQVDGDWWSEERFNLKHFNINNGSRCVLGQVVQGECNTGNKVEFRDGVYDRISEYHENATKLGDSAKYLIPWDVAKAFGFHLLNHETEEWSLKMNRGWYALIAHRQGVDTVHPDPMDNETDDYEDPDDEGIETDEG